MERAVVVMRWLGVVALALAACATSVPPEPTTSLATPLATPSAELTPSTTVHPSPNDSPSATPVGGPDLPGVLVCHGSDVAIPADALRLPADAELASDPPARALQAFVVTPEAESLELPVTGWRRVADSAESVTFLANGPSGWVTATVTPAEDGTWQFWEGGGCPLRVQLPDQLGFATWRLDPADPPVPADRAISVLLTETDCASGKPPHGRILPPVILSTDDAVTIAFAVRKALGDQDCPSNPEVSVVIELAEPLGDRRLFDGSVFPAALRGP